MTVHVNGMETLLRTLKAAQLSIYDDVRREIRTVSREVLSSARSYANGIRYTGAYAASFSLSDTQRGVKIKSSDPGAGTIEFANRGAVYLKGRFAGRPIGVPRGAKPRALIPAVLQNEQNVLRVVERTLERACDQVRGE